MSANRGIHMVQLDLGHEAPAAHPRAGVIRVTSQDYARMFFRTRLVRAYLVIGVALTIVLVAAFGLDWRLLAGFAGATVLFSFFEYIVHRFVYHNRLFFKFRSTAQFWRHLHYAHHMNPNEIAEIAAPAYFTLPVVLVVGAPIGWLVGGLPGALAGITAGVWLLMAYEYAHGYTHLVTAPGSAYGGMLRRLHMLHHFHSEKGNYGVTSPIFDFIFGSYYASPTQMERCSTVRNLGYTEDMAKRYPWVERGSSRVRPAPASASLDLAAIQPAPTENGGP